MSSSPRQNGASPGNSAPHRGGKKKRKQRTQLLKRKLRYNHKPDDIPECPSIESVVYDEDITKMGANSASSASMASTLNDDSFILNDKKRVREQLRARQRAKDIAEIYGEDFVQVDSDGGSISEIFLWAKPSFSAPPKPESSHSTVNPPELKPETVEKIKRHRKQGNEVFNQLLATGIALLQELLILLQRMVKYCSRYPTPAGVAVLVVGIYLTIVYVEFSAAAFLEWTVQWMWPTTHIVMRACRKLLVKIADLVDEIDDICQSAVCEMADAWCTDFGRMCHKKCSFINMAVERSRRIP